MLRHCAHPGNLPPSAIRVLCIFDPAKTVVSDRVTACDPDGGECVQREARNQGETQMLAELRLRPSAVFPLVGTKEVSGGNELRISATDPQAHERSGDAGGSC